MTIGHNSGQTPPDARHLTRALAIYREPSSARSAAELAITALPLVALWMAAWFTFWLGYAWATPLIAIPAAGFLVRLFMIQHDCGHGAFFSHRQANDWVGRVIGVLTLTPYDFWRRTHAMHHATAGNLDRRGMGDVDTLTVSEYRALSRWGRLRYRLYRHPLVMFGVGPAYLFLLQHRLPVGLMRNGWQPWVSTMATNLAIALIIAVLVWFIGIEAFLLVHLPIFLLAAAAGVWLFYVQHQFEHTTWQRDRRLEPARSGPARQLALRPAGVAALVHRQYRRASRASPVQPHTLLPVAARAARPSRTARHRPADLAREPALRAPGALGRDAEPPDIVPRAGGGAPREFFGGLKQPPGS